jgi:hypothetical protein
LKTYLIKMQKLLLENLKLLNQSTKFFSKRYNFYQPNIEINNNMGLDEIQHNIRQLTNFIKHPELGHLYKHQTFELSRKNSPT